MRLPTLNGILKRRILINYKADPDIVRKRLPPGFRPIIINGYASAGICLIRLQSISPCIRTSPFTWSFENAAYRYLIEREEEGGTQRGVYIPCRYTDSYLNLYITSRLFSWPHYHARFDVKTLEGKYLVKMKAKEKEADLFLEAIHAEGLPETSMFSSVQSASDCFASCSLGYSPARNDEGYKKLRLSMKSWDVQPLKVLQIESAYFDNEKLFPPGSIAFDHALLMQNIEHQWTDFIVNTSVMIMSERFYKYFFTCAAVYNMVWGIIVVLYPNLMFTLFEIPPVNYPFLMSGIGMFVGVYGYGYWVVSRNLFQYPQLVVIGLLGKTLGPVGWAYHVLLGDIPLNTMWVNVFNDFIWLPFFISYLFWQRKYNPAD